MPRFMLNLLKAILRYPRALLVVLAVLTALVASEARHTRFDASIKSFILDNDRAYAFYNQYKRTFGQDDILVVAFQDCDIFTPENLRLIRRLTERIESVDNVYDVRSITNAEYIRSTPDSFEAAPLVDEIPDAKNPSLDEARRIALSQAVYRRDLISDDAQKTAIIVTLAARGDDYEYHDEIRTIESIVREEEAASGKTLYLTGERYIDLRFLEYIHRDLEIFIPITTLILALLLFLIFRNVRETVIGLAAISACLLWTGGLIPLSGGEVNSITAGLPSLILCIAVTDAVHLLHRYRHLLAETRDYDLALDRMLDEAGLPCLLTSVTTAIGFGSLIFNEVHPIKGFGALAALGVSVCFPLCMTIVPALLKVWKAPLPEKPILEAEASSTGVMARLGELLIGRRWTVGAGVLLGLVLCAVGFSQVKIQIDRVRYLKESSDVFKSIDFIEKNLAGTTQLDIWVEGGKEGVIKEPETLQRIEALATYLRAKPEIDKVICINDFLKEMNKAFYAGAPGAYALPKTRDNVAQFLLIYSMSGRTNELDKYVDYPYSRTRISVRASEHNSVRLDALIADIEGYLKGHFHGTEHAELATLAISNNNVFHYLLRGLVVGLGIAVVIVGLVLAIGFRSLYVGIISMIPNVVPIIACLGLMGWADVWLETATAMTFSIALGIAVDDTIHLISRYRLELARTGDPEEAVRRSVRTLGWALVQTTLIISGGFLVLVFASLKMNIVFGLLAAFIMFVALAADLVFTPVCLLLFKPFAKKAA